MAGGWIAALAALLGGAWQGPAQAAEQGSAASRPEEEVVARGDGLTVSVAELEPVLLERFAFSREGREILRLLLSAEVLDRIGRERGLRIEEREVDARWEQLDREIQAAGERTGLRGQIAAQGLGEVEFRDYLRLSLLHERLTRQDLGLAADRPVTGEQQEIWLEQEMNRRGLETLQPPWPDGVVARCGDVRIGLARFATFLRERLPRDQVKEACWHLLLLEGIERRMPQISPEALDRGLDDEVQRRRLRHAAERPELSFEAYLAAQGRSLQGLRKDPSVRIATLSRLWVDRTEGEVGLRGTYERERELFEGRFGEALRAHLIFLVASRYKNQLNPRTFEEAEEQLAELANDLGGTEDFAALAARVSEEPQSRERGGDLGWITRGGDLPAALRDALFARFDLDRKLPAQGLRVGPVRLDTGCALLWISGHRESPSWEEMSEHVHEELRRRFLLDVMPESKVELL